MKLAVNYSTALLRMIEADPKLPVDYIKVPTIPFPGAFTQFERGGSYRPLLPHTAQPGVVALGHHLPDQQLNPELVTEIIRRTRPPYLSTHLEARVDDFPQYRMSQHQDHPMMRQALKKRFLEGIDRLQNMSGLPLLIENFPYYTWSVHFKVGAEPAFIREICEAGDCGFLLDIAHARCSAWSLGMEPEKYLMMLPLERLREIHLAGVMEKEYGIRDSHTALDETGYELFALMLDRCEPEIVSLEYGGMPDRVCSPDGVWEELERNRPQELEEMIYRIHEMIQG